MRSVLQVPNQKTPLLAILLLSTPTLPDSKTIKVSRKTDTLSWIAAPHQPLKTSRRWKPKRRSRRKHSEPASDGYKTGAVRAIQLFFVLVFLILGVYLWPLPQRCFLGTPPGTLSSRTSSLEREAPPLDIREKDDIYTSVQRVVASPVRVAKMAAIVGTLIHTQDLLPNLEKEGIPMPGELELRDTWGNLDFLRRILPAHISVETAERSIERYVHSHYHRKEVGLRFPFNSTTRRKGVCLLQYVVKSDEPRVVLWR
ncbi:MAG: hypothetical protein KVP17_005123 [Porospora cf. gigantea B]|uniref:uncharacterized protein n=1 Tax=Porospora cf. gigantea B TaxID=2853592 RepID=UPI0035719B24|nr:MAG: hypothetical protein KVP17_005123 [Porospora cf. gigantea B]